MERSALQFRDFDHFSNLMAKLARLACACVRGYLPHGKHAPRRSMAGPGPTLAFRAEEEEEEEEAAKNALNPFSCRCVAVAAALKNA